MNSEIKHIHILFDFSEELEMLRRRFDSMGISSVEDEAIRSALTLLVTDVFDLSSDFAKESAFDTVIEFMSQKDYILEKTKSDYPKSTVPKGTLFVMGDNRNNSEDSRFADVGFVPFDLVKGKAMLVFWPLAQFKALS